MCFEIAFAEVGSACARALVCVSLSVLCANAKRNWTWTDMLLDIQTCYHTQTYTYANTNTQRHTHSLTHIHTHKYVYLLHTYKNVHKHTKAHSLTHTQVHAHVYQFRYQDRLIYRYSCTDLDLYITLYIYICTPKVSISTAIFRKDKKKQINLVLR